MIISQQVDIFIEAVASDGRGIGRFENRVVFVSQGIPGQKLRVCITAIHKKFVEGIIIDVLEASPNERVAQCKHHGVCGGCSWQHMSYETQLFWKQRIVRDTLEKIGTIKDVPLLDIIPSPREWAYRNKIEFAFYSEESNASIVVGLRKKQSHEVIPVTECLLQSKQTMEVLDVVRDWIQDEDLPYKRSLRTKGYLRFLVIRRFSSGDFLVELIVNTNDVVGNETLFGEELSSKLFNAIPTISGFVLSRRVSSSDVAYGEEVIWSRGTVELHEDIGPFFVSTRHDTFFQVNTEATKILYSEILRMACLTGQENVLDLYAGVGSISLLLAPFAHIVTGVEVNGSAVEVSKKNAKRLGYTNCIFKAENVDRFISRTKREAKTPYCIILDPPRSGLSEKVCKAIIKFAPEKCIYVSCNPGTLARDIAVLKKAFMVSEVRPIDMFPHTPHVETVTVLNRR